MWREPKTRETFARMGQGQSSVREREGPSNRRENAAYASHTEPQSPTKATSGLSEIERRERLSPPARRRSSQQQFQDRRADVSYQYGRYRPRRRSISPPPIRRDFATDQADYRERRTYRDEGVGHHSSSPFVSEGPRSPQMSRGPPHRRSPPPRTSPVVRKTFQSARETHVNGLSANEDGFKTSSALDSRSRMSNHQPSEKDICPRGSANQKRTSLDAAQEKIDFNGLTGVPTGPKIPTTKEQNQPHIFILAKDLAPMPTTRKHLAKFIRISEGDIQCDDSGWRIFFQKSAQGLQCLEKCYSEFHLQKLFSQYVLNMQCFPNGTAAEANNSDLLNGSVTSREEPKDQTRDGAGNSTETSTRTASPVFRVQDYSHKPVTGQKAGLHETRLSESMGAPQSAIATGATTTRLSPTATRVDKDDSSSVSALSSSDTSGSKGSRCHVCRTPPLSGETLMHCTTCPRKYHRRCSPKETMPVDPSNFSMWQCQRCIKKQISPRSRLSIAPLPSDVPEPLAGKTNTQDKHDLSATPDSHHHFPATKENSEMIYPRIEPPKASSQHKTSIGRSDEPETADSLVEDAFASSVTNGLQLRKTGRLNFVRKKIAPPMAVSTEPQREDSLPLPADLSRLASQGEKRRLDDDESTTMRKAQKLAATDAQNEDVQDGQQTPKEQKQGGHSQDQQEFGKQITSSTAPALGGESSTASGSRQDSAKPSGPTGKRNKLQSVAMGECARCQKPMALHPSGKNIHCVKCKKELAASLDTSKPSASPVPSPGDLEMLAENLPPTSKPTYNPPNDAIHEDAPSAEDAEGHDPQQVDVASKSMDGGSNMMDDRAELPPFEILKKIDHRTACESCRTSHKRCIHGFGHETDERDRLIPAQKDDVWAVKRTPTKRSTGQASRLKTSLDDGIASQGESESDSDGPVAAVKRKSFRSRAKDEYDLGNATARPKGTYEKLIGMALCSAEERRMTSGEIVKWIVENVPDYPSTDGNGWEAGIRATIVLKKYRPLNDPRRCPNPLWYTTMINPSNKSQGSIVELMENLEETMLHWDPVLKIPRSPVKLDHPADISAADHEREEGRQKRRSKGPRKSKKDRIEPDVAVKDAGVSKQPNMQQPVQSPSRREALARDMSDVDMEDVLAGLTSAVQTLTESAAPEAEPDSSDDEPLLQRSHQSPPEPSSEDVPMRVLKERSMATPKGKTKRNDSKVDTVSPGALDAATEEANQPPALTDDSSDAKSPRAPAWTSALTPEQPKTKDILSKLDVEGLSLADVIKRESEPTDYSANSLFDEWPEYMKPLDKAAKLAEIQARPRRKQRFRAPLSRDPRTSLRSAYGFERPHDDSRRSSVSFDRLTRTPNKAQRTFDIWESENAETGVTKCDTWEEFFELPINPTPIVHDGHLAYRERTQDEHGRLRRANVIYKTGYA